MLLSSKESFLYALLSLVVGQNLVRRAEEVRSRASWPAERLQAFSLERCQRVLRHAAERIPYYRRQFQQRGFRAEQFSDFSQLSALPVLTRDQLRASFAELQDAAAPPSSYFTRSTGGTTGTPVAVVLDRKHELERMLVTHRMYAQMGRRLGDSTLLIAGSPVDFELWSSLRERVKNRLFNITVRSSFRLDPISLEALLADLRAGRHRWVIAYASVFDVLCAQLEQRGATLQVANIVPCAELVSDAQRERWRRVLGAQVFEIYGSREMVSMAGETPQHCHLRVNADLYHVEITDEAGAPLPNGEPGLITVTNLLETTMPMVRYQLEDIGVLQDSSSGDAFPRLKITHGRVLDIIRTPQGKLLPGEFFPHLMKEVHAVVQRFQVVQTEVGKLTVRIVRTSLYSEQTTRYLESKIREQVGQEVEIEFEFVPEIETSPSGKYRPTISRIGQNQKLFC